MSVKHTCLEEPAGKEKAGTDLFSVLALGRDFLAENGLGLRVYNYWCCKRVLGMVRAGLVPIPRVMVSLAGRDYQAAEEIALYLRRSRDFAQPLVVEDMDMSVSGMRGVSGRISHECCRLAHKQRQNIKRFSWSPQSPFVRSPPFCLENVEVAIFDNRLRVTAAMFRCLEKMAKLKKLEVHGSVVVHEGDEVARDWREPHASVAVPADKKTLVSWLPDTLEELDLTDSFIWADFLFGNALRDRVAKGGFAVLKFVCLAGLFRQMSGHDAHYTLLGLQGVASLEVLELGVKAASWNDGWDMRETHVAAAADFKAKRPGVRVIC
jgi:hypothetical protein